MADEQDDNTAPGGGDAGFTFDWLNRVDDTGQTPLSRAAGSSYMVLTEVLLRRDAEDRAGGLEGATELHQAAYQGQDDQVRALLDSGADVHVKDKYGETPLHKAARNVHESTAAILLEYGADANEADVFGLTPLHWTALNGHAPLAEVLMLHHGDPHVPNAHLDGLTPLDLARIMAYGEVIRIFETYSAH